MHVQGEIGAPETPAVERRVLVAIVHNQPMVLREAAQSILGLLFGDRIARAKAAYDIRAIDVAWFTKLPRVDSLRDLALEQARRDGFSHVLFLDADMLFPDDLLLKILRYVDRPAIVSGFYTLKHPPYAPVAFVSGEWSESKRYRIYRYDDDYRDVDADGLRAEEVIGMGCALIPLSIVAALGPRPWFEYRNDDQDWPLVSEDVPFCEKVRGAGFPIYLDPSIQCGHLFQGVADERYWQRYRETILAAQARLAGHLTMTPAAEAKA